MEVADCYRLLGLRTGASYEDIKASYRRLARRYHPDANPDNEQQAKEKFIQLTDAYRLLMDIVSPTPTADACRSSDTAPPSASDLRSPRPRSTAPDRKSHPPRSTSPQSNAATPHASTSPTRPPKTAPKTAPKTVMRSVAQPRQVQASRPKTDPVRLNYQLKQQSYEQLQHLLREQRFPRAIALVEGLAQRLPEDSEVRQWQAITYQLFGRYLIGVNQAEKASLYLKKALRTDPSNRSLWYEVERDFCRIERAELL